MKFGKYLCDKWLAIILFFVSYFIIFGMLLVFQVEKSLIIAITIVYFLMGISVLLIEFFRKKGFYNNFVYYTNLIDKKYLILEMLYEPKFYEGDILYQNLYEINKSMTEKINDYRENISDFKEYIEMWIHEVKIPISSLVLMCHNHKNDIDEKYIKQIRRLDNYVDQVLYYMRSNYAENDYLIKEVRIDKIVGNVLIKNKDDLLENEITLLVDTKDCSVMTDAKWIEFILNQIINNSMKYKREDVDSVIRIEAEQCRDGIILSVYDNGVGIPGKDLPSVFKKSFTGENGRKGTKSTGMGLYITKKLCTKLGHRIEIESKENEWTKVKLIFGKNDYYKM